ncbi:guanylate cyclase [Polymorphobacter arshaanensis]|uniref:Guanylate cyclase n=1 Tax=Glacieibacterium arshaanense TaxID=2511025 RepID=A0A4Y9EPG7_9SPHN|nr:heme NO-binding domain-containing protein [Polymorphobacter arshaanensis]TFU05517.1 guanylate cyclase [Polymorphobacter arshaanensis]
MKGIIFTELVGFLETRYGIEFADAVITDSDLENDGAFTSVGNYPSRDALTMVGIAAQLSGSEGPQICEDYGAWLYGRFNVLFPEIMARYASADALLIHVGSHIHEEVRVLYPDAKPPQIDAVTDGNQLTVTYRSHRPMAHIAYGLIRACLDTYGDLRQLRWAADARDDAATFIISAEEAPQ